ncbi:4-(cytidine 5'-diphospho)-2-C-methyl-D-erythritol kinase [Dehalobacterium formicoaceticum]|uniref:4-diphosphocytidyl-2-C-methyl-D-erythritol kinase n=1 Tax=Dehalobacterium formicoaceticum TaxID=51515 RepID=A0ABT1Y6N7_9FIRM|nr:4-(cytidine 5'-diphospho)-2-C-methyl-D-erythritol kinase [Dehalobacterium formicoaceticum]MCR6545351.1 4-(cytidine 5'-diphospho)-2-C-methyl-D-erythritol kinase [Dehalobacterium formicoaceticum]
MESVELLAPAKINLSLDVIGQRENGYHDVRMVMQSISLADQVRVTKKNQGITITSNVANIPLNENNIAVKAWKTMAHNFHLSGGIQIHLEKRIPVEAGLAGGSSNAAAVLKAVNLLYDLRLPASNLAEIGQSLGADVAYCIEGGIALAEGIGEILTPLPTLPEAWMVLVNPGFGVSTKEVYQALNYQEVSHHPDTECLVQAIKKGDWRTVADQMVNVLEEVTVEKYPQVGEIKKALSDAGLFSLMSGSGPTVFGIAETKEKAIEAGKKMQDQWKTVLVAHTV